VQFVSKKIFVFVSTAGVGIPAALFRQVSQFAFVLSAILAGAAAIPFLEDGRIPPLAAARRDGTARAVSTSFAALALRSLLELCVFLYSSCIPLISAPLGADVILSLR
jgi:hypothetical protein